MTLDTPLERIAALVETFPNISPSDRDTLLLFAKNTPLTYGAWKHFKSLWKKAEAQALNGSPDVELLSTLIARLDDAAPVQPKFRWKTSDQTKVENKNHSVAVDGITCTVGSRQRWDYRGFRILVTHHGNAAPPSGGLLRRAIEVVKSAPTSKVQAFDFEVTDYVYHEVKKVELKDGILKVHCALSYSWNRQPNTVYEINVSDQKFIYPVQLSPSSATFGYMKRRARRFLRQLSTHNSELYLQLALNLLNAKTKTEQQTTPEATTTTPTPETSTASTQTTNPLEDAIRNLQESGVSTFTVDAIQNIGSQLQGLIQSFQQTIPIPAEQAAEDEAEVLVEETSTPAVSLDPKLNWVLMDILLGASPRWEQSAHGRGAYLRKPAFALKRREERAQSVWDAHFDVARSLYASSQVPVEANEMALKILRSHGEDVRVLDQKQAQRFWQSQSPVLQSLAARDFATRWDNGEKLGATVWAQLLTKGNADIRRSLNNAERLPTDAKWLNSAAKTLETALGAGQGTKARRAAQILLQHFDERISAPVFWHHLQTFAALGDGAKTWVLNRVRQQAQQDLAATLMQIALQPPDLQNEFMAGVREEVATRAFKADEVLRFVAGNNQPANALGWQMLAASQTDSREAREIWRRVWNTSSWFATAVHQTAAQSEAALQLFRRADFSGEEIENLLERIPAFFTALTPAFFVETFRVFSPSTQVARALIATDEQWRAGREVLLETLREPRTLGAFWNRVLENVKSGGNAALQSRILDDAEISNTFIKIPAETIEPLLERTDAAHEEFLVRWLDANISSLQRGDGALLFAAIHPMSPIRERGLKRLGETGLDLPTALRLMESELPQPFSLGRAWFENNTSTDESDLALALCDSPEASVRAFGREFLEARGERVLNADILQKLGENADPQMQAWLAENLLQDAKGADVQPFDRAVLRTRGKARRAKEAIKMRRDQTHEHSQEDITALLEMARGRTARDREWALQQLAQLALSGQNVDGLTVENVGGASCK